MVDLQTAMAAASAERRQRSGAASEERKVRRSGPNLGLEPFDPVKHVSKEKADTASMWLVIAFSVTVSVMMRYVLMPNTCLLYTSPSPRDGLLSRMPSSA